MTDAERLADGQLDQIERALVSHENSLRNNPIFPWRSDIREFLIAEHRETLKIARALQSELAEAKMAYSNVLGRNLPLAAEKVQAQEERDAALAEVERWKDDYDEEARACEENARETQEARDEAEALRAAVNKALDLLADNPDGPQLDLAYDVLNQALGAIRRANRDARPHQWAEGGFCNTHMTYGCGKARLSPPAPAPKHEFAEGGFCNAHMTYGCECPAESLHDPKAPCPECGRRKKPAPGGREE